MLFLERHPSTREEKYLRAWKWALSRTGKAVRGGGGASEMLESRLSKLRDRRLELAGEPLRVTRGTPYAPSKLVSAIRHRCSATVSSPPFSNAPMPPSTASSFPWFPRDRWRQTLIVHLLPHRPRLSRRSLTARDLRSRQRRLFPAQRIFHLWIQRPPLPQDCLFRERSVLWSG